MRVTYWKNANGFFAVLKARPAYTIIQENEEAMGPSESSETLSHRKPSPDDSSPPTQSCAPRQHPKSRICQGVALASKLT